MSVHQRFQLKFANLLKSQPIILKNVDDFWVDLFSCVDKNLMMDSSSSLYGIDFGKHQVKGRFYPNRPETTGIDTDCCYFQFQEEFVVIVLYTAIIQEFAGKSYYDIICDVIGSSDYALSKLRIIGEMFLIAGDDLLSSSE